MSPARDVVYRAVIDSKGRRHITAFPLAKTYRAVTTDQCELSSLVDASFLRYANWPRVASAMPTVRIADLYSGCGAMSLGVWEACRAMGRRMEVVLAVDSDPSALAVYRANFPTAITRQADIRKLLDAPLGAAPSQREEELLCELMEMDLLVGGPPCQGHSNLNNHSRRTDPKNRLYDRMARFCELAKPKHVIIENVQDVLHDKSSVVGLTKARLQQLGYATDDCVIDLSTVGVPQRRRRHVLIASLSKNPELKSILAGISAGRRTVEWAISDLLDIRKTGILDRPAIPTVRNQKRIDFLFKHRAYDLPNSRRPDCHKLKQHTYNSVYGRLHWDLPAQTITSGFRCMGQGRFVHPKRRRTLTPHEAARLQCIPDFFTFTSATSVCALAQMIGNAVPPKIAYALALALLR